MYIITTGMYFCMLWAIMIAEWLTEMIQAHTEEAGYCGLDREIFNLRVWNLESRLPLIVFIWRASGVSLLTSVLSYVGEPAYQVARLYLHYILGREVIPRSRVITYQVNYDHTDMPSHFSFHSVINFNYWVTCSQSIMPLGHSLFEFPVECLNRVLYSILCRWSRSYFPPGWFTHLVCRSHNSNKPSINSPFTSQ
jgi:hypothetical protein